MAFYLASDRPEIGRHLPMPHSDYHWMWPIVIVATRGTSDALLVHGQQERLFAAIRAMQRPKGDTEFPYAGLIDLLSHLVTIQRSLPLVLADPANRRTGRPAQDI